MGTYLGDREVVCVPIRPTISKLHDIKTPGAEKTLVAPYWGVVKLSSRMAWPQVSWPFGQLQHSRGAQEQEPHFLLPLQMQKGKEAL